MTHYYVAEDQTYTDTAYNLRSGDILSILTGVNMTGHTYAPLIVATSAYIENYGNISNYGDVIRLDGTSLANHGSIAGSILGSTNVETIVNDGTINSNLFLLDGNDFLNNQHGTIFGFVDPGAGNDLLQNNYGAISGEVFMGSGDDTLINLHGLITGDVGLGTENDYLDNSDGVITGNISGGLGDDVIVGGAARDVIYGDNVSGDTTGGRDTLSGGGGNDIISGGYGADTIYGNQGDDLLFGNQDNDFIHGGQGNDTIYGGKGDDTINGGSGDDALFGNLGNDTFVFNPAFGHDSIYGFDATPGEHDVIQFAAGTFADYADLQAHMTQNAAGVSITLDAADTIVLLDTGMQALTADHFLFG